MASKRLVLSVSADHEKITIGDTEYAGGFVGELDYPAFRIEADDAIVLKIPELSLDARIENASELSFISLGICHNFLFVVPYYSSKKPNEDGCWACKEGPGLDGTILWICVKRPGCK